MSEFKSKQNQQEALQRAALAPKWKKWLQTLDPVQREVLEKNKLIDAAGVPVIVQYKQALPSRSQYSFTGSLNDTRYVDSKISLQAAQRLMALDPTSNHVWTDWIFTQAGGGEKSRRNEDAIVAALKRGLQVQHATKMRARNRAVTSAELEAAFERAWAEQHPRILAIAQNAHEDALEKIANASGVTTASYGFSYDFPGYQGRYAAVENATKAYFSIYKKAVEMNALLTDPARRLETGEEVGTPVPVTPDEMEDVDAMNAATKAVRQFFQARSARSDVRVANWKEKSVVYDDDLVTVIVPLTYSAAVKYGNDAWPWANRRNFQQNVKSAVSPEWSRIMQSGFIAYMMIHVPLRTYLTGERMARRRTRLNHVALHIAGKDVAVYREDGTTCTLEDFMDEIHASAPPEQQVEPPAPDPLSAQGPIVRQARYPLKREDVSRVEASVQAALEELRTFDANFDSKAFVRDVEAIDITQP